MINQSKSHAKLITIILLLMTAFLAAVIYFGLIKPQQQRHIKIDGVILPQAMQVEHFKLIDHQGNEYTEENLKGHWTMMFFGFTNCGMVCPLTMAELNLMYKKMQNELPTNQLPQVVMVSVDPDRDSQEKMKQYVTTFNPNFIGLRADITETVALEKQLHIAAAKIEADGAGKNHYTINHTADVLLFNPEGRVQAYLAYPHKADQMIQDYKSLLSI